MHLLEAIEELFVDEQNLAPLEQYESVFKAKTPEEHNTRLAQKYEEVLIEKVPSYKPLTSDEKTARKELHDLAVKNIPSAVYSAFSGTNGLPDELDSQFKCLFCGLKNTPEDNTRKAEMTAVLLRGSPEQRHELFLDAMDKLADFDYDAYRAMTPKEKVENFSALLPTMYLAIEAQDMVRFLDRLNCGITAKEKEQFFALCDPIKAEANELIAQIDCMYSPYYADMDLTTVPLDEETQANIKEGCENRDITINNTALEEYQKQNKALKINGDMRIRGEVAKQLNKEAKQGKIVSWDDVCLMMENQKKSDHLTDDHMDMQRLRSGEKVKYTLNKGKEEVAEFCDLNGDGFPTEVPVHQDMPKKPAKVDKPNGFVMFFDNIFRKITGKGFASVDKYNSYVRAQNSYNNKMAELKQRYNAQNRGFTTDFNNTARTVKQNSNERKQQKAAQTEAVKAASRNMERGRQVAQAVIYDALRMPMTDLMWAKENPEVLCDAFKSLKEEFLKNKEGSMTEKDIETINAFDMNIQACETSIQSKFSSSKTTETTKVKEEDLQELMNEPLINIGGRYV